MDPLFMVLAVPTLLPYRPLAQHTSESAAPTRLATASPLPHRTLSVSPAVVAFASTLLAAPVAYSGLLSDAADPCHRQSSWSLSL